MSYFGTSGPAQDGGFIAGIGAGANRLKTARATRARHSKDLGSMREVVETTIVDFDPEKEGAVEYVVKDAWPKNWVQYALYGGVAYYIYYKLSRRKANRTVTARKGAFYGVFS